MRKTLKRHVGATPKKYQAGGRVSGNSEFRTGGTDLTENARERSLRAAEDRAVNRLVDSYLRIGAVPERKIPPTSGNYTRDLMARDVNRAREIADEELMRRRGDLYRSVREGGPKEFKKGGKVTMKGKRK